MQLVIMRHGEAEAFVDSDKNRQLTSYGREQAVKAGACLADFKFDFQQLWVSPYIRAQQTAEWVLSSLLDQTSQADLMQKTLAILTPDNNPSTVISALETSDVERLLIVSHQPLVSHLIASLVGVDSYSIPMAPASMALLQTETIAAGCFDLKWLRHSPNYSVE
jgi:phosphohistidine phosphatase SixA